MNFYNGDSRILYIKWLGEFMPIACLNDNPFSESSEMLDTTTRDNAGWKTSVPVMQNYSISFSGLQLNSTQVGGNFDVASYDKLKEIKRGSILIDWKIQGTFPVVDYGKGYITALSEGNPSGDFLTFSGNIEGFGVPLMASLPLVLLNDGDPTRIITDGDNNLIQS